MARAGLLEAWSSERRGSVAWAPVRAARAQEADTQAGAQLPGVLTCPLDPGDSSWGISGPAGLSPLGCLKEPGRSAEERRKGSPRVVVGVGTEPRMMPRSMAPALGGIIPFLLPPHRSPQTASLNPRAGPPSV